MTDGGADDPVVPFAARRAFEEEMRAAGVADWRLEVYGRVGHSFTNPSIGERGLPGSPTTSGRTADRGGRCSSCSASG